MLHPRTGSVPSSQVKWLNQSINPRPLMFTWCYVHASAGEIDAARSRPVTMRRETRAEGKAGSPEGASPRGGSDAGRHRPSAAPLADTNVIFPGPGQRAPEHGATAPEHEARGTQYRSQPAPEHGSTGTGSRVSSQADHGSIGNRITRRRARVTGDGQPDNEATGTRHGATGTGTGQSAPARSSGGDCPWNSR